MASIRRPADLFGGFDLRTGPRGLAAGRIAPFLIRCGVCFVTWLLLFATTAADAEGQTAGPPRRLVVESEGETALLLFWENPADTGSSATTAYEIESSSRADSGWTVLDTLAVSIQNAEFADYEHSGLTAGTVRFYRVSAINGSGKGATSNVAGAATEGGTGTAPGAPTNLAAMAAGDAAIDLSWTAPADSGSSKVLGYQIFRAFASDASFFAMVFSTTTTYTATDVSAGAQQYYQVAALNNSGFGPTSSVASATAGTGPGIPSSLTATADGDSAIDLSWTAPADSGASAITGYQIESSRAGNTWGDLVANTGSTATTYRHGGLQPGTTRHYRVSAINSAGAGSPSNVDDATTGGSPGAPTSLTAAADADTAIDLSWTEPADSGNSAVIGYRIEVSPNDTTGWYTLVSNTNSTGTTFKLTSLASASTWYFRVSAINSAGFGMSSNVASATTTTARPGVPTSLTAAAAGDSAIDLSWTAPADSGASAIIGYRIESSRDGNTWADLVANTGSTATTYRHGRLQPGTTRHYRVSAVNSEGAGLPSNVDDATTTKSRPGAPTSLTAAADADTAIDLSWTAPADSGNSAVVGYRIERSPNDTTGWSDLEANTNSTGTTYKHTGLASASTWYYRVSAINSVGPGMSSNVANAPPRQGPGRRPASRRRRTGIRRSICHGRRRLTRGAARSKGYQDRRGQATPLHRTGRTFWKPPGSRPTGPPTSMTRASHPARPRGTTGCWRSTARRALARHRMSPIQRPKAAKPWTAG